MFLGAGAEKNLYYKIFSYLDKTTLALCRTHICKDWYALIAKPAPWTALEIYEVLHKSHLVWPAFKAISKKWLMLPSLDGRWTMLLKRCLEKDEVGLIHWLSKREKYSQRRRDACNFYCEPMVKFTEVVEYIVHAEPTKYPRLWTYVIEKVQRDPIVRLEMFWYALFGGSHASFCLFIKECWETTHMIFDIPKKYTDRSYAFYSLCGISKIDTLKQNLLYLHTQGAPALFWKNFIYYCVNGLETDMAHAEDRMTLLISICSLTQHVDPLVCEYLREKRMVNNHNKIRPWCTCAGPVLRNRKKQKV